MGKRTAVEKLRRRFMRGTNAGKWRRFQIYILDNGECVWCGKVLTQEQATMDHFKPAKECIEEKLTTAQANHWRNVVLACHRCNNKRGNLQDKMRRDDVDWFEVRWAPKWASAKWMIVPTYGRFAILSTPTRAGEEEG